MDDQLKRIFDIIDKQPRIIFNENEKLIINIVGEGLQCESILDDEVEKNK